jgi:hypothetical protein
MKEIVDSERAPMPEREAIRKELEALVQIDNNPHLKSLDISEIGDEEIDLFGKYLKGSLGEIELKVRIEEISKELHSKGIGSEKILDDSRMNFLAYLLNKVILSEVKK